jgi:hypothetical protein
MVKSKRSRTPSKYIYYALYLYFSGLSLRKTSEHLLPFVKRNHVSIWELDSTLQANKAMEEEKKSIRIHCR